MNILRSRAAMGFVRISSIERCAMKTIISVMVVLSVLAGVAPANAFDTKTFYEQQDRQVY